MENVQCEKERKMGYLYDDDMCCARREDWSSSGEQGGEQVEPWNLGIVEFDWRGRKRLEPSCWAGDNGVKSKRGKQGAFASVRVKVRETSARTTLRRPTKATPILIDRAPRLVLPFGDRAQPLFLLILTSISHFCCDTLTISILALFFAKEPIIYVDF
ncbi:hypothetical protein GLAREA_00354 [Glarea lozoyensis ATCC 20868]|uniref:Uncharacterized protein n=1 Tax=Glarea lozoyensis (strain ATCC 20868 / MF5171) TaxID=1116229 RepID=S3CW86_GLAL2|nr:uncharacterized protein GLAREA_00354 [Glarea lozoyensis ATCC 20868]EPE29194.1 hypothetical protein GLAREA_00354 [Glarea lozoyensis ATCC 20868]